MVDLGDPCRAALERRGRTAGHRGWQRDHLLRAQPLSGQHFSCATFRLLNADSSGLQRSQLVYDMNQLDALVSCGGE